MATRAICAAQSKLSPDQFDVVAKRVFAAADTDTSGFLDAKELVKMLRSPTLGLRRTIKAAGQIVKAADLDGNGHISLAEFVPLLRDLLSEQAENEPESFQDWVDVTDPTGEDGTIYYNRRTQTVASIPPIDHSEWKEVEDVVDMETIVGPDGVTYTIRYNEDVGRNEYLDFEANEWREYAEQALDAADGGEAAGEHTTLNSYMGQSVIYFGNEVNQVYYMDESTGEYAFVPISHLALDPYMKQKLGALAVEYPEWDSMVEMMMVLQITGYHVPSAIKYANENGVGRAGKVHTLEQAIEVQRLSAENLQIRQERDALKAQLDAAVAKHIDTEKRLQSSVLKTSTFAQEQERLDENSVSRLQELTQRNWELEARNKALEAAAMTAQFELEEITKLRKTVSSGSPGVAAAKAGGGVAADAANAFELADERGKEIASLKTKVAALMKTEGSSAVGALMQRQLKLVKELKRVHAGVKEKVAAEVAQLWPDFENALAEVNSLKGRISDQNSDLLRRYMKESALRRQYFNTIQELRGNIRTFVRIRKDDRNSHGKGLNVFEFPAKDQLMVQNVDPSSPMRTMEFARVFAPTAGQDDVFSEVKSTILSVIDGYNVCLMAYGQTGSGKTYTMMGPKESPGVNRRAVSELITQLKQNDAITYSLAASQCEVYNEGLYDLLSDKPRAETKLRIQQQPAGIQVIGLTKRPVTSEEDIWRVLADGDRHRSVAATKMNTASSRSHLIFQVWLTTANKLNGKVVDSVLTLVDLAGSERIKKSGVSGQGLMEAAAINKSLSALGLVFMALSKKEPHIPYKNSTLTHTLADCLGGNAKCAMFINCSPLETNLPETVSSLRFAQQIAKIELGPGTKGRAGQKKKK